MSKVSGIVGKWGSDSARAFNRASVMKIVQQSPGIDRTRLAESTGLTNAAMTGIVQELVEARLLKDVGQLQSGGGRGRRRTGLSIDETGGYVLGISILAFNSSVALTDVAGNTLDIADIEPSDISDAQQTLDEVAEAASAMLKKHAVDPQRVFGAGVAVAGYFNSTGDVLDSSPYLGWPAFDIRSSLAKRLNLNTVVDNVNRCIAVAESRLGRCAGAQELVLIRAALGLGGAIISDGNVLRGSANQAGQIGHLPAEVDGTSCSCGKRGCLNTVASGSAILHELGQGDDSRVNPNSLESREKKLKHVLTEASSGNTEYRQAIEQAGRLLGHHCAGLLHVLAPQMVVLTGPLGRNETYCSAFAETLAHKGITAEVITAYQEEITAPAPAASALALSQHVYSPQFDIQHLLAGSDTSSGETQSEALVL